MAHWSSIQSYLAAREFFWPLWARFDTVTELKHLSVCFLLALASCRKNSGLLSWILFRGFRRISSSVVCWNSLILNSTMSNSANLQPTWAWKTTASAWFLIFSGSKRTRIVIKATISFQLCNRECPRFQLVDAGLEASQNQNELNLVVDISVKWVPSCSLRKIIGV